jgi:hypothetical protein
MSDALTKNYQRRIRQLEKALKDAGIPAPPWNSERAKIIRRSYRSGGAQKDLAAQLGVSSGRAHQLIDKWLLTLSEDELRDCARARAKAMKRPTNETRLAEWVAQRREAAE